MKAVFSSEAIDHHNHKMLMAGGDLTRYLANPVLLYFHDDNQMPVGIVKNLNFRKADFFQKQLVGEIVWDEADELALKLKAKYEKGIMKGFSIRASIKKYSVETQEGKEILVIEEWELLEISCVSIPSNPDAIVIEKSIAKNKEGQDESVPSIIRVEFFGNNLNINTEDNMKEVFKKLGIVAEDKQNEQEVLKKIGDLETRATTAEGQVKEKDTKIENLETEVNDLKKAATNKAIDDLVDGAVVAKKITPGEASNYKKLAATDFEAVKSILDSKQGTQSVTTQIQQSGENDVVLKAFNENKDKGYMWFMKEKPDVLKALKEKYPAQFKELEATLKTK